METTANCRDELVIYIGEDKNRIRVTDSAVEAVQAEAAGIYSGAYDQIGQVGVGAAEGFDVEKLLELRDLLVEATDAVQVLLDCRPAAEWGAPE